jgi:undecaprenyl-diphosphatase
MVSGLTRKLAFSLTIQALAAASLFIWLSLAVSSGQTTGFDEFLRDAIHSRASPPFTAVMWFFTFLGTRGAVGSLLVISAAIFWSRNQRSNAIWLIIVAVGAEALTDILKLAFHRARPLPYFGISAPHSFSYPSGHALLSFAFFSSLALVTPLHVSRRWIRVVMWLAAITTIALIGLSRVYLGVHYPTDVLGGYLAAFLWVVSMRLAVAARTANSAAR